MSREKLFAIDTKTNEAFTLHSPEEGGAGEWEGEKGSVRSFNPEEDAQAYYVTAAYNWSNFGMRVLGGSNRGELRLLPRITDPAKIREMSGIWGQGVFVADLAQKETYALVDRDGQKVWANHETRKMRPFNPDSDARDESLFIAEAGGWLNFHFRLAEGNSTLDRITDPSVLREKAGIAVQPSISGGTSPALDEPA